MRSNSFSPRLHYLAIITSLATWLLIVSGAAVTSTESGLSVPDWPLSYGSLFPPMVGGIRFEHTHRLIAGSVGILTLILSILLWRKEDRRWVRTLGTTAFVLIVIQALLGGLTVILMLPPAVSILHALTAQTFFVITVVLISITSSPWTSRRKFFSPDHPNLLSPPLLVLALTSFVLTYVQLILGAMKRHGVLTITPHVTCAVLLFLFTITLFGIIAKRRKEMPLLWTLVCSLAAFFIIELSLGLNSWLLRLMNEGETIPSTATVIITVAHVALGALILAGNALLALITARSYYLSLNWK